MSVASPRLLVVPESHSRRRAALRALLQEAELEALLVTDLLNIRYLTGFTGSNAALLVHAGGEEHTVFCTDRRYTTQSAVEVPDLDAAIEVTKRYVEVEPEDLLGFTNLSMFYQKKGMIKEAEAAGAEARRLDWKRQLKEAKEKGTGS